MAPSIKPAQGWLGLVQWEKNPLAACSYDINVIAQRNMNNNNTIQRNIQGKPFKVIEFLLILQCGIVIFVFVLGIEIVIA